MAHFLSFRKIMLAFSWILIAAASVVGSENDNCFSIIVGKSVSADGHMLVAHNEDDKPPQVVNHQKVLRQKHASDEKVTLLNGGEVDQVAETWSFIWSEIPGLLFSDSYINEWGVVTWSNNCRSREDQQELTDGGIGYYLSRLVAERARSAREGVHIAAELVERFGYDASGRTYTIADTTEGWMFCAVNGKHWLARRVPDDSVAMIANSYSVHEVDLSDTVNFLASPDIIDYAITRGWHNPDVDGEFDFAAAYANPDVAANGRNIGRQWSAYRQVTDEPPEYDIRMPFCISPSKKLHPRDLMSVLRDHYEGTDLYENPESGNPHDHKRTPICRYDTQTSFVVQLRSGMPVDIGVVYWVCLGSPCSSFYWPHYFGLERFPAGWYTQASAPEEEVYLARCQGSIMWNAIERAFWNFSRLRSYIEEAHATRASVVREVAEAIESGAFNRQPIVESAALTAYNANSAFPHEAMKSFSHDVYWSGLENLRDAVGESE